MSQSFLPSDHLPAIDRNSSEPTTISVSSTTFLDTTTKHPQDRPTTVSRSATNRLTALVRNQPLPEWPRRPQRPTPDGSSGIQTTITPVEAIVTQVETALADGVDIETAIGSLELPQNYFPDQYRARDDDRKRLDAMVRAFIYLRVTGRSYDQLARDLDRWDDLPPLLGFESETVSRGTFTYTKQNRFTDYSWNIITEASRKILETAHDVGVNPALLAPNPNDSIQAVDEAQLRTFAVRNARNLVFDSWTTDRAANASYTDIQHLRQAAYMAMADSGTPSGSRRHAHTNGDALSGNRHLELSKHYNFVDIVQSFQASVEAVIDVVRSQAAFTEPAIAAIDVTPLPYWGEPAPNPMMARMVAGQRREKASPRALKFGTITTTGETVPMILGVVPVQEASAWGGVTYPRHKQVAELLRKARRHVSLRLLLMDRAYDGLQVARTVTHKDLTFLTPLSTKRAHQDYHIEAMYRQGRHVDVERWWLDVEGPDGEHVETLLLKQLYVPSTRSNQRTAVFRTNDPWVDVDTVEGFVGRYRDRWGIENQFRAVKSEFLCPTDSRSWEVRAFYFYLGCALQNAWRLADFYYQDAHPDLNYDGETELTAGEFVDLAAKSLSGLLEDK